MFLTKNEPLSLRMLVLIRENAPQRERSLRNVLDALRWLVKTGAQWRYLPNDFPPWAAVYQQVRRWFSAKAFEATTHDLREILRLAEGRNAMPSAVILDGRTLQSTPESGPRRLRRTQKTEGLQGPHGR